MDISLNLGAAFLTVIAMGLSCGIGCGSISTPFIITRVLGEEKNTKQSFKAVLFFTFGKILMLGFLGFSTSLLGIAVLNILMEALPFDVQYLFNILCFLFGCSIIYNAFKNKTCFSCNNCNADKKNEIIKKLSSYNSYLLSGAIYAFIPCVPLTASLAYSATISPFWGALLLVCFGFANSISSLLVYAPVTGWAVSKMKKEIPQFMKGIKVIAGGLLIVISTGIFNM